MELAVQFLTEPSATTDNSIEALSAAGWSDRIVVLNQLTSSFSLLVPQP